VAVVVVVAAPFSPFPSVLEVLVEVVRVRGVRCDISVLLAMGGPSELKGAATFSSRRQSKSVPRWCQCDENFR
jgi:hypothetical protein